MEGWQHGGSCRIETTIGTAHGILLSNTGDSLETKLGLRSEYARKCTVVLITNHHVIPNINVAKDCTIRYGREKIKLEDVELIDCISCCGNNGILGKKEHRKIKTDHEEEPSDCPFQLDFTILFLDTSKYKHFTQQLKSLHLSFNCYDIEVIRNLLNNYKLQCIQRTSKGGITSNDLTLLEIQSEALNKTSNTQEEKVDLYNTLVTLTTKPLPKKIQEGSSGAPIVGYKRKQSIPKLVGVHRSRQTINIEEMKGNRKIEEHVEHNHHTNIFWILWVVAIYQGIKHCISILILNFVTLLQNQTGHKSFHLLFILL